MGKLFKNTDLNPLDNWSLPILSAINMPFWGLRLKQEAQSIQTEFFERNVNISSSETEPRLGSDRIELLWQLQENSKNVESTYDTDNQYHYIYLNATNLWILLQKSDSSKNYVKAYRELTLYSEILSVQKDQINNEKELIDKILDIIVVSGNYKLSWLSMFPNKSKDQNYQFDVQHAAGLADYVKSLHFDLSNPNIRKGPTAQAVLENKVVVINNFSKDPSFGYWRERAKEHGLASSISVPLQITSDISGVLCVYSESPDAFDDHEKNIMMNIGAFIEKNINTILLKENEVRQKNKILDYYYELSNYKRALDEAGIVSITDFQGKITYVSENFVKTTGYSPDELLGKTHSVLNSGHHPPDFFRSLWSTLFSKKIWQGEICNRNKSGELFWLQSTLIPITDVHGNISQFVAFRTDITERKKLKQQRELMSFLIESTEDAIIGLDLAGNINYWNQGAAWMYGYFKEEVMGKHITLLIPQNLHDQEIQVLAELRSGRTVLERESFRKKKNGEVFPVMITASLVKNDKGEVIGISKIDRSIEELKKAENERNKALYDVKERFKELTLLYRAGQIFEKEYDTALEAFFQLVPCIPAAMQFPEITLAEIVIADTTIRTSNWETPAHCIQENILTKEGHIGHICIGYKSSDRYLNSNPFLSEEVSLIKGLASQCSVFWNRFELQQQNAEKEYRIKTILNNTSNGYLLFSSNLELQEFNTRAVDICNQVFNCSIEAPNTTQLVDIFGTDQLSHITSEIQSKKHLELEISKLDKEGKTYWLKLVVSQIDGGYKKNSANDPSILFILQDITDSRIVLEQKNQHIALLKELSFITSHEIRHESTKLEAMLDLLKEVEMPDKELEIIFSHSQSVIQALNSAIQKLNAKINDLD